MENLSDLKINAQLIRRNTDFSFFDPNRFQLLKMNADAFELLDLIDQGSLSGVDTEDADIRSFVKTCIEINVLVTKQPNEERRAYEKNT